jgi:hypothetical protein
VFENVELFSCPAPAVELLGEMPRNVNNNEKSFRL